ncbi:hypothetical protein ACLB2K_001293 [Fragaria x ananassa]
MQLILVAVFRLKAADVGEVKDREMGEAEAVEQNESSETIPSSPQPQKENAVVCDIHAEKKHGEEMEKLRQEKTKFEDQAFKMIAELFNTEQDLKECLKEMEQLDAKIAAKGESKLRLISELKATSEARSD